MTDASELRALRSQMDGMQRKMDQMARDIERRPTKWQRPSPVTAFKPATYTGTTRSGDGENKRISFGEPWYIEFRAVIYDSSTNLTFGKSANDIAGRVDFRMDITRNPNVMQWRLSYKYVSWQLNSTAATDDFTFIDNSASTSAWTDVVFEAEIDLVPVISPPTTPSVPYQGRMMIWRDVTSLKTYIDEVQYTSGPNYFGGGHVQITSEYSLIIGGV